MSRNVIFKRTRRDYCYIYKIEFAILAQYVVVYIIFEGHCNISTRGLSNNNEYIYRICNIFVKSPLIYIVFEKIMRKRRQMGKPNTPCTGLSNMFVQIECNFYIESRLKVIAIGVLMHETIAMHIESNMSLFIKTSDKQFLCISQWKWRCWNSHLIKSIYQCNFFDLLMRIRFRILT
jgi:hypothetical protein